jgi:hypothetical protein
MYLDLDDAVAGHPQAQRELAELRARIAMYEQWSLAISRDKAASEHALRAMRELNVGARTTRGEIE